jgi:hypothetical protein
VIDAGRVYLGSWIVVYKGLASPAQIHRRAAGGRGRVAVPLENPGDKRARVRTEGQGMAREQCVSGPFPSEPLQLVVMTSR